MHGKTWMDTQKNILAKTFASELFKKDAEDLMLQSWEDESESCNKMKV